MVLKGLQKAGNNVRIEYGENKSCTKKYTRLTKVISDFVGESFLLLVEVIVFILFDTAIRP